MKIELVPREHDPEELYQLFRSAMETYVNAARGTLWNDDRERTQFLKQLGGESVQLILFDDHVVGFIDVRAEGKNRFLHTMIVAPRWQSKGIGTAVLDQLKCQSERISLTVLKENPRARSFYEQAGFHEVSSTQRHYQMAWISTPIYRLSRPFTETEWSRYHAIRREVLWETRGIKGVYNADHPDEHAPNNHPVLLFFGERAIGVVRIDIRPEKGEAIFRRVAIQIGEQRRGHGTALMRLAEDFAASHGCSMLVANVAPDAIPFYAKLGYRLDPGSPENDVRNPRMIKERRGG